MHKHLLSSLLTVLIMTTPMTKAGGWWDWSKDNGIAPVVSAGLAVVGIIGLSSWLLSESDHDVINQAQHDLSNVHRRFNTVRHVYEQTAYDRCLQDQELKLVINQHHGHEQFHLLKFHETVASQHNLIRSQINKVQSRLSKVESKMAELSRYDEKFEIASRARIQLCDILKDLELTARFLGSLEQRVGSWQEFAHQKKKYRKHQEKLEQERRERERERKLRDQQYELERMNNRVRQLEYEKRYARQQVVHCNCGYNDCVHVVVNI